MPSRTKKRRPDAVTPELHREVLLRDRRCFLAGLETVHQCRDLYGNAHAPTDLRLLTVDHVHDDGGVMGKRAPSDLRHLVAICGEANVRGPSREVRQAERQYLRNLYER